MTKIAVITGIAGQDGAYLADFLLKKGYRIVGLTQSTNSEQLWRLNYFNILNKLILLPGDILDARLINHLLRKYKPVEFYNLAGQSSVSQSWLDPVGTFETNATAVIQLLEVWREINLPIKFFQASSAEIYGETNSPVTENYKKFTPINPYGISKLAAHLAVNNFRTKYGLLACNGILFNHESPLKNEHTVTKEIARGVAKIKLGRVKEIALGNIDVKRDWGFAGDFVQAIWLMLQQKTPHDFVICTGVSSSIKDFLKEAFLYAGIKDWSRYLRVEASRRRSVEVQNMRGSSRQIQKQLGWRPKTDLKQLVKKMVDYELEKLKNDGQ